MSQCCGKDKDKDNNCLCRPACNDKPVEWFSQMIKHCYEYAQSAKNNSIEIVGIMCEYTPRELIMAAGAIPVCLCGGSLETIAAAQKDLPANLCPLIKSTYGYHLSKSNPFLEMASLVVAETTCDGKKKMYELMSQTRPVYVLELPQKPQDNDAFRHWIQELRKFKTFLEKHFNRFITDQNIRNAIAKMNKERQLRRELASAMKLDNPPYSGRTLLDFKSIISGIESDFQQYQKQIQLNLKTTFVKTDGKKIRVLVTGVPIVHGAEKVIDIIESNGGLVVCMDNCTGLKPIMEDVDIDALDPIDALAKKYLAIPCSVMTKNEKRFKVLGKLIEDYRPDCVIEVIWQACLTYDIESYFIEKHCKDEYSLPYLKIETDYSLGDIERIAVRIQALFEIVKNSGKNK